MAQRKRSDHRSGRGMDTLAISCHFLKRNPQNDSLILEGTTQVFSPWHGKRSYHRSVAHSAPHQHPLQPLGAQPLQPPKQCLDLLLPTQEDAHLSEHATRVQHQTYLDPTSVLELTQTSLFDPTPVLTSMLLLFGGQKKPARFHFKGSHKMACLLVPGARDYLVPAAFRISLFHSSLISKETLSVDNQVLLSLRKTASTVEGKGNAMRTSHHGQA